MMKNILKQEISEVKKAFYICSLCTLQKGECLYFKKELDLNEKYFLDASLNSVHKDVL